MCDEAVIDDSSPLHYVPDWFVISDWVHMWYVDSEYRDYDGEVSFFKWYDSYKKRKAQKASIKEEVLPIAWHPSRHWNWCMPEDEKKRDRKIVEITDSCFLKLSDTKMTTLKYQFKGCFSVSIKLPKNFSKTYNKR